MEPTRSPAASAARATAGGGSSFAAGEPPPAPPANAGSVCVHGDEVGGLGAAVLSSLHALATLRPPAGGVVDGRVEQMLRRALAQATPTSHDPLGEGPGQALPRAQAAVRAACVSLAAGELEDAYLALDTARDSLRAAARVTAAGNHPTSADHEKETSG